GCMLHGRLYPFGLTERTEDCFSCRCNAVSMRCCSLFHTPVGYDRKNCKVVFNKETCNYDVVRKNDPSKECVVYSSI
ncbi:Beta-microseminoprotein, partial [Acanthisitta chloris]